MKIIHNDIFPMSYRNDSEKDQMNKLQFSVK